MKYTKLAALALAIPSLFFLIIWGLHALYQRGVYSLGVFIFLLIILLATPLVRLIVDSKAKHK